ncbi:MAG: 16S rRNA (adenine(1518)-N(6)/adenine(1519)-N(6))-dimethyltransferase RsmA [Bacteroidota bacterium]
MIKPKKSLGQHFLTDRNVLNNIVREVNAVNQDRIIEIGPGTGALTRYLVSKSTDVHALEVDERAIELLKGELPEVHLHKQDVLKADWEALIARDGDTYVVGNLPYYITSPILFALLAHRTQFKEAILMMQKEVAERLVANSSTKAYGILSVQTQLMSTPELLFDVSPNSFSPPPKVMSSVIRLRFNSPALGCTDHALKHVVRTAFNQRRKKLSNALKRVLGDYIPPGFDLDERAEHWSPQTYAKLAEHLEQNDIL